MSEKKVPKRYIMLFNALLFVCAVRKNIPHKGVIARYEIIYPPVGPARV